MGSGLVARVVRLRRWAHVPRESSMSADGIGFAMYGKSAPWGSRIKAYFSLMDGSFKLGAAQYFLTSTTGRSFHFRKQFHT